MILLGFSIPTCFYVAYWNYMYIRSASSPSTVLWAFHTIQPSSLYIRMLCGSCLNQSISINQSSFIRGLPYGSCLQSVERQLLAVTLHAYSALFGRTNTYIQLIQ